MLPAIDDKPSLLDSPLKRWLPFKLETFLVILLLLAAVVSRFYDLGARTVSHDEVNHVTPAYSLFTGAGYQYDPLSHGPLQFHMMALSYALFGDNDFTSRIPAAVFSVAAIVIAVFAFRRYLGRTGALVAGLFLLISPLNLFYGRYERNEAFIVLWGLLGLYAILRYIERGESWVLLLFTLVNALHFTDKATSYMLAAEEFLFLGVYFIRQLARRQWQFKKIRELFFFGLVFGLVLIAAAVGLYLGNKPLSDLWSKIALAILLALGFAALIGSAVVAVRSFGWDGLRSERTLSLLILLGTFILPLLGAIPLQLLGYTPLDYTNAGVIRVSLAAAVLGAVGIAIGLAWFGRRWLYHAALFFIPFIILYSTFFTAPLGIIGGLVGALSYWTVQQGVARGGQPLYYYAFLLVPIYEFMPLAGTLVAAGIAIFKKLWRSQSNMPFTSVIPADESVTSTEPQYLSGQPVPTTALFIYWAVSSLAVFTYAGEKMPWLTIHIALPMILSTAWAIGWMVDSVPWKRFVGWTRRNYSHAVGLAVFILLAVITARSAYRAAFINYDNPLEYLVYAHAAPDPKKIYNQVEELSQRMTGGDDMLVAYDNMMRYPFWWYMRRYSNKIDFDVNPSASIKNAQVIVVGDENLTKLAPVLQDNYTSQSGMRLWWPNMDYWNLKWNTISTERNADLFRLYPDGKVPPMTVFSYLKYVWPHIRPFFTDAKVRHAIWEIWFNRDYTAWAALKSNASSYTLADWGVSNRLHLFIRKDIGNLLWPLGAPAVPVTQPVDPYAGITSPVTPDVKLGSSGSGEGQFLSPRQLALAPDGTLYVADSLNHRIQHLSADGTVLQVWGSFADISAGEAPGGTFNEPWGVAVGPDGSVYVADTWNYRIQKFTSTGEFVKMWGSGPALGPDGFYGPRGLAVDGQGRVYVADTGNKRIVIYDGEGNYLSEFGGAGMGLGQLDEPVGVAVGGNGRVYVTDTWNQRVQVFQGDASGLVYSGVAEWAVEGWYGNSLENKPFVAVDGQGNVSVTDPELCRVIEYSMVGQAEKVWDGCSAGAYALPSGIVSDGVGGLWVSDARSGTLVHFKAELP